MGKKNYKPVASIKLLKQLEERYWETHVNVQIVDNGKVSRNHVEWNMFLSGCSPRYARQLINWKAKEGCIRIKRIQGSWILLPNEQNLQKEKIFSTSSSEGN